MLRTHFLFKSVWRVLYRAFPFKRPIFVVIRKVTLINNCPSLWQHLHFHGPFEIRAPGGGNFKMLHHGFISENQLFWGGIDGWYERTSAKVFAFFARDARTIVDVGANTGVYSLIAEAENPQARIIAFEPVPSSFDLLCRNLHLNESRCRPECVGLSSKSGKGIIRMESIESHYSASIADDTSSQGDEAPGLKIGIEVVDFDTYARLNDLANIDLIKIDVERHEPLVLMGMSNILERDRPTLVIEVLDDEVGAEIQGVLRPLDYVYFNVDEQAGLLLKSANVSKSLTWNFICVHRARISSNFFREFNISGI